MKYHARIPSLVAAAATALACTLAQAAPLTAIQNDGLSGTGSGHSNADYAGWTFSITKALSITALGLWAGSDNTLSTAHQVGIFNLNGQAVMTTNVSGSGDSVNADNYVFENLNTPITLLAGTYFVGAYYAAGSADTFLVKTDRGTNSDGTAFSLGDGITLLDHRIYFTGTVGGSVFATNTKTYLGANFQYELINEAAAQVPEPAGLAFAGLGALALAMKRRRKA